MASPDLLKGIAKEFLEPLRIGITMEMLNVKLEAAIGVKDTERVRMLSSLIERVEGAMRKQAAATAKK